MKLWVYIYEDEKDDLRIALSTSDHNIMSSWQLSGPIVYIRPFKIPFDAVAHKHLLDDISKKSVLNLIDKYKDETGKWLELLFGSDYSTH